MTRVSARMAYARSKPARMSRASRYEVNQRMARRRGFRSEFELRDARAKAEGYRSYWDKRKAMGQVKKRHTAA